MSTKKDYAKLEKLAKKQGFRIIPTNSGHKKWIAPNGSFTFTGSTEGDYRGLKNHLSKLRKMGYKG